MIMIFFKDEQLICIFFINSFIKIYRWESYIVKCNIRYVALRESINYKIQISVILNIF